MVKLGSYVRDKVTGLTGYVMARTEYLTGCVHIGIAPNKVKQDGTMPDWQWIDEGRCDVVERKKSLCLNWPSVVALDRPGGPAPNPPAM